MTSPIRKLLIANRGEIALRVIRTARTLGISTVAVYSDADANAMFVKAADEAVHIGPSAASESYLIADKILNACKVTGADAVHPGYGFLSENPGFARALADADIKFLGPSAEAMEAMALKGSAKALMEEASVPVVPGYHGDDQTFETLKKAADEIGYPVLIKAVAGGGGKGMRQVFAAEDMQAAVDAARREGENSFGNGKLLIEKYITKPRHIEVQVFGDRKGNIVSLFERDCSLQRRHQKVVEEAPAPGISAELREVMCDSARRAAAAIHYTGAGTVEFIVDVANGIEDAPYYFMEMNTRLQVEHPVTELITGQDLVEWQIRVAEGHALPATQADIDGSLNGHAVEVRLYAEDPDNGFLPSTGEISLFDPDMPLDPGARLDAGVRTGDQVTVFYDPMIAKVIAWGKDRDQARATLIKTLGKTAVAGLATNRDFLIKALAHPSFATGDVDTGFIARFEDSLLSDGTVPASVYASAALVLIAQLRQAADIGDVLGRPSGWRLNLPATDRYEFMGPDGDIVDVIATYEGASISLRVGDALYPAAGISALTETQFSVTLSGHSQTVQAHVSEDVITLADADKTYKIERYQAATAGGGDADGPGQIVAPMPGKILSVLVENGAAVDRGDPLLIMEAMKMEQTLSAPRSGLVDGLSLTDGDLVKDGAVLLSILDAPATLNGAYDV